MYNKIAIIFGAITICVPALSYKISYSVVEKVKRADLIVEGQPLLPPPPPNDFLGASNYIFFGDFSIRIERVIKGTVHNSANSIVSIHYEKDYEDGPLKIRTNKVLLFLSEKNNKYVLLDGSNSFMDLSYSDYKNMSNIVYEIHRYEEADDREKALLIERLLQFPDILAKLSACDLIEANGGKILNVKLQKRIATELLSSDDVELIISGMHLINKGKHYDLTNQIIMRISDKRDVVSQMAIVNYNQLTNNNLDVEISNKCVEERVKAMHEQLIWWEKNKSKYIHN